MGKDISKLPKWAREEIIRLNSELSDTKCHLENTKKAHSILLNRRWFTLKTQFDKPLHLWILSEDKPHPVCSLFNGDVLMIGRSIEGE